MLASLDVSRPAAREQLRILGEQAEVGVLPEADRESPAQIAKRALQAASLQGYDVVILDTAGRVTIDEGLMAELREIKALTNPHEILLVADAMTGQDAVTTAAAFNDAVDITGIVLTRVDGDARGGARGRRLRELDDVRVPRRVRQAVVPVVDLEVVRGVAVGVSQTRLEELHRGGVEAGAARVGEAAGLDLRGAARVRGRVGDGRP